jgi:hypothetical protein
MWMCFQPWSGNTSTSAFIRKPEAATTIQKVLLMMGKMLPETCWAAFTRLNNKRFYSWVCVWLVVLFEYLKIHGTTNHKFYYYLRNTEPWFLYYEAVITENPFTKINKSFPALCSQSVLHVFATFHWFHFLTFVYFIAGNDNRCHAAAVRFSHISVHVTISEWQVSCSSRSHLEFILTTTSLLFCLFMKILQPRARESIFFAPNQYDKCNEKFTNLKFASPCIIIRFKWINQPDATNSQVYYLTFTRMYSSTCFGRPHAHHQELNSCYSSCWAPDGGREDVRNMLSCTYA